jgi:predicted DNA-binding protein (MmcQ/YjbR family)
VKAGKAATKPGGVLAQAELALRAHAMSKPGATEHFPWGERAIKVKGKVFLFMYAEEAKLSLSTKLPASHALALMLPFAQPTAYGLGKAGWVTARFEPIARPPVEMLCAWIDESYRAIAPAKLALAGSDAPLPTKKAAPKSPRKRAASKVPPTKRPSPKPRAPKAKKRR